MARLTNTPEPILASWKISDVLGRYPTLLDVLVGLSPAFGHLRNPVMRRVQARLVTVAQAARVAGLDPATLVRQLNAAVGLTLPPDGDVSAAARAGGEAEPPAWLESASVAAELDARPLLRRGEEPFSAIMAAVAEVPPGQVFRLRSTFEPAPLYDVLGRRGFTPWARRLGPDDWEVSFLNTGAPRTEAEPSSAPPKSAPPLDWESPSAVVTIDVSELVPPEPMIKILEALEALPPGGRLLVHHVRRPMHLYPRLDELGCRHETRELGPNRIEVLIQKPPLPWGDRA